MIMARTFKDRHDMDATGNHSMYDSWQRYEKRTIEKDFEYFIYKEEDTKDPEWYDNFNATDWPIDWLGKNDNTNKKRR